MEHLGVSASVDCVSCAVETQDTYSDGDSPHKSIVSDDADELYGDSIDEDSQSVKPPIETAPAPSTSGALCIILLALSHFRFHTHMFSCCSLRCPVVLEISFDVQRSRFIVDDGVGQYSVPALLDSSCLSGQLPNPCTDGKDF